MSTSIISEWSGTITVLRCTNLQDSAAKRWTWEREPDPGNWTCHDYNAGTWFHHAEYPINSLHDLGTLLEEISRDPHALVVRGAVVPSAKGDIRPIRRTKLKNGSGDPFLLEMLCPWLMIDVDNFPLRASDDLIDAPELVIERAIFELLPAAFHDVAAWWQLSSSAGFVPGVLKCHLFFWLSEPTSNERIKAVLREHAPGIDDRLFNAAHAHYIAAPLIQGAPDPLPRRAGWRKGAEDAAVVLPRLHTDPASTGRPKESSPDDATREACLIAQNLARCGFACFPCHEDTWPASPHGVEDATTDADRIASLWERWPAPLIAIATGTVSNLWAISINPKHPEAFLWWQANHHRLLPTRAYESQSAGIYLHYRNGEGINRSTRRICKGIDICGDGDYAIHWFAAGYTCRDHSPPAPWPAWLRAAHTPRPRAFTPRLRHSARRPPPLEAATAGIVRCVAAAQKGERNALLFWGACRLFERGLSHAEIEGLLLPPACGTGLPETEIRRTIASAQGRGAA
jgi:hypothetical protein